MNIIHTLIISCCIIFVGTVLILRTTNTPDAYLTESGQMWIVDKNSIVLCEKSEFSRDRLTIRCASTNIDFHK